ncbi:hypothetical protein [Candidiatus Paracoxiella cheracis]|uniref:hypothetical protein n=1 Tax=Candidiatus Paracoxiella cheracis TaxID=3405120 RepID=UPI003BF53080
MTARKDFLQSLTLGKKSEPTAEYAPSLRSPWRASDVCLVVFPHANDFIEIANNMSIYNYSLNYVKKLAQSDHISFVNLTAVFKNHQEYFADMSHLDPAGAKALMPILIKNCFEKNSNPTTGP